jgi:hypothetical protein
MLRLGKWERLILLRLESPDDYHYRNGLTPPGWADFWLLMMWMFTDLYFEESKLACGFKHGVYGWGPRSAKVAAWRAFRRLQQKGLIEACAQGSRKVIAKLTDEGHRIVAAHKDELQQGKRIRH